ncbi:NAD(P)-dependent alcohol dehydrogenase [Streptomyces sp. ST1015]|uniref:NAD(P)-dependent alcohol dehydrogenase n=1 Tax=Streptomyces sp. ST1015 TaxID=1848900 RepID=UPI001CA738C2|nr:NAD(P)-dependent alcohol dehydrogenase [Streptomyces sp. ST1015]QZZ25283.1 NAD(P)-dependent alcohol dehydrogenase [Streptomyces sp. ST1015]
MKILAAVAEKPGQPFRVRDLDLDAPGAGEVLVRMAGTGICHTDLSCRDQWLPVPLPAVLGHEGAGVVTDVGPGIGDLAPGDRVVLSFDSCGSCRACAEGRPASCGAFFARNFSGGRPDGSSALTAAGTRVNGAFFGQSSFATHAVVARRSVVKVPADCALPLELLGPLACGFQTGAGAVLNALRCRPGSSIAVFGAGAVGCAAVMAAAHAGCTTIAVAGRSPARLARAAGLGATHTVDLTATDAVTDLRALTAGAGVDYSIEATGAPGILRQAVDCLAPGGVCGLLGAAPTGTEVSLDMSALLFGRQVRGIVEGDSTPAVFIPALLDLHRRGRFPFDRLISLYPLDQIGRAVDDLRAARVVKPVLTFPGDPL